MPTTVRVRARQAFEHDGIAVEAGAWIALPAATAAILARQGLVNLSRALETRVLRTGARAGARAGPRPASPLPPRRPDRGEPREYLRVHHHAREGDAAAQGRRQPRRLVSGRPRVVSRRLAAERRDPHRERDDLRGGLCLRHDSRAGHRQAAAQVDAAGHPRRLGRNRLAGLLARAQEAQPLPDADRVLRAVGDLEADARQHLRVEASRPARRGDGVLCARSVSGAPDGGAQRRRVL